MAQAEDKKDEAEAPKKGRSKVVIALIAVVALGGLGGGAYVMLGSGGGAEAAKPAGAEESHSTAVKVVEPKDAIAELDTFVVNMADENAQRYLKVTMKVEFFGDAVPARFTGRQPQIRDLLLSLLGSKSVADVRTIEGKQQLRDEVIARITRVLEEDSVKAVYFSEFIIQ